MSGHSPLPAELLDLPMLPLRDVVVFPHMVIPLFVGRAKSIKALESAMLNDRRIMLVAQKTAAKDEPEATDMFEVGCVSTILQMLKLPDGTVKVLVEGQQRAKVQTITDGEAHFVATVIPPRPTMRITGIANLKNKYKIMCTTTSPSKIVKKSATLCDCLTKIIVAAIAPGPAKSGVPRGTRATLTSPVFAGSASLPVRSSNATSNSSKPPDA